MWFMNHLINPLVRLILKSRLHRMMSAAVLLLIYRGRKSGKEYQLPVQYVQDGKLIYILPGAPEKKTWWRNLSGGTAVQLVLRGKTLAGQAGLQRGKADEVAMTDALGIYFRRFPAAAKLHQVNAAPDGSYAPEDLRLAAQSVILVRVNLD
jgi:hypothetical protein